MKRRTLKSPTPPQHREEKLQNVPITVAAATSEQLAQNGRALADRELVTAPGDRALKCLHFTHPIIAMLGILLA